jgi:membrane fusion protein (multidrug efflux system)
MMIHKLDRLTRAVSLSKSPLFSRSGLAAIGLALAAGLPVGCEKPKPPEPQPPVVEVMKAPARDVPIFSEWIGTLDGIVNATIKAQVSGYLISRDYTEGSLVKQGQVLFQIDPRPFEARLAIAQGQLAEAEARYGKTQLDVKRFTPLAQAQAISQQELDDAIQNNLAAKAAVESARANVLNAELNLEFTTIKSPVTGIAGIAQAQVGDLVGPGSVQELTAVSKLNPIRAYFNISEQAYLHYMQQVADRPNPASEDPKLKLTLILANGQTYAQTGEFSVADRQINVGTGTLLVAGEFPNPDNVLRPGQFVRVRAMTSELKNVIVIPQRAVNEMQGIYQVAVVGPDNKVAIKTVQVGPRTESDWVITQGLNAGDTVIVEGFQKVRSGSTVSPQPYQPTKTEASATPATSR